MTDADDAADVLRLAFTLVTLCYEVTRDLHATLLAAAGPHLEAFNEAALSLASVMGVRTATPDGSHSLDHALALGSREHGAQWPNQSEALGLIVQAIAAL